MVKSVNFRARLPGFDFSCVALGKSFNPSDLISLSVKKGGRAGNNNTDFIDLV